MTTLSSARVFEVAMGFRAAKTLLSAIELDLFSILGDQALTGEELCSALKLHPRANPDFFDALLALCFLERDGTGAAARYTNTAETKFFLARQSPAYIGNWFVMASTRTYQYWGGLTEALKTGQAQNESKNIGSPMFDELYRDAQRLEQFQEAMSSATAAPANALAAKFGFDRYHTLCDVGGGTGQLVLSIATCHPHLRCITSDLPAVTAIAARKIAEAGLSERVTAQALDFFTDPLPQVDVITMGKVLHNWDLDKKLYLIRAAYEALPVGGALIAIEGLIDDARRENVTSLLGSLTMMIEFGTAANFTGADFSAWCRSVGFHTTEIIPLVGAVSAAVAYK